jgi:hypothetical protein
MGLLYRAAPDRRFCVFLASVAKSSAARATELLSDGAAKSFRLQSGRFMNELSFG